MVSLDEFKREWLNDIVEGNPSTTELGNRFSHKLLTQWLGLDNYSDEIIYCDGSCDGGIDVAFLQAGDEQTIGDTWYVVQSKYGTAFQGASSLFMEATKLFDTLTGNRTRLNSLSTEVVAKISNFIENSSSQDKLILVFATNDMLSEAEKKILDDIKILGRQKIGAIFDVETICIDTIYQSLLNSNEKDKPQVWFKMSGQFSQTDELLVGSVKLTDLFYFLKKYKNVFGDLDLIYEKNVRKYLGSRRKVNKGIAETLNIMPERFGLYNNGITIVVTDFRYVYGELSLTEPYIVNGCQTTKTIWTVLSTKLDSGGSGKNTALEKYKSNLDKGIVVVKIVKVGEHGEELLTETTRYTNSQNSVSAKDFLALEDDFRGWAKQITQKYGIYFEIQRGGWDAQQALQKQKPATKPFFTKYTNCFDMIKVYSAGWYGEPSMAFRSNTPFAPDGTMFKEIVTDKDFGATDLYAAYLLSEAATQFKFGNKAEQSRKNSRYLFFMVFIELLKHLITISKLDENLSIKLYNEKRFYSECIIAFAHAHCNREAFNVLLESAIQVIDEYLSGTGDESYRNEPYFKEYSGMVNFLKVERFNKADRTPVLHDIIGIYKRMLARNGEYATMQKCISDISKLFI